MLGNTDEFESPVIFFLDLNQEMVGIVAVSVLSGYVHNFAFFQSAKEADKREELLWHLGK